MTTTHYAINWSQVTWNPLPHGPVETFLLETLLPHGTSPPTHTSVVKRVVSLQLKCLLV